MKTRRHFLQSSTSLIALPALESLGFRRFASAATPGAPPKRLVFLGFGWGITTESWFPDIKQPGADYTLPEGLKPLARHKADFSVVQGLWNKYSNDGHWGSTMWLTGANRFGEPGQNFHNSISADQVAAAKLGLDTRRVAGSPAHAEGDRDQQQRMHGQRHRQPAADAVGVARDQCVAGERCRIHRRISLRCS